MPPAAAPGARPPTQYAQKILRNVVPKRCHGAETVLEWCSMPNINLRLSDDEHAALVRAATGNRRSLQKEIISRLFPRRESVPARAPSRVEADAQPRDVQARTIDVKPDFKQ